MIPSKPARTSPELRRLALSVLQPGFEGTEAPTWLLRSIGDGLSCVVLFGRNIATPEQVARLTSRLRAENPDLMIAIDEEAGDVTRLESWIGSSRPGNYALGAVDDLELTAAVARDIGRELHAAGVSLDYAPSADVNTNPDNPVIGVRSFGADPDLVARHTAAWIGGLQSAGVAACAKHFPGHGDTTVDSHHGLPVYEASLDELAAAALPPFRAAVDAGVRAIMTGHLLVPVYDPDNPATMSGTILNDVLRGRLGFDGLIVTDGIEMGSVVNRYGIDGAAVRAIAAGADAVCVGGGRADEATVDLLSDALLDALDQGALTESRLAEAAGRVSAFAAWSARLRSTVPTDPIRSDMGFAAARRAVRLSGPDRPGLPLTTAPHVAELVPTTNLAIARQTPWGVSAPLRERMPGTTSVRIDEQRLGSSPGVLDDLVLKPASGRPLVVVVRDASRHGWMRRTLSDLVRARPDIIVVEMGVPGADAVGVPCLFTHGATAACGVAAAEVLVGTLCPT